MGDGLPGRAQVSLESVGARQQRGGLRERRAIGFLGAPVVAEGLERVHGAVEIAEPEQEAAAHEPSVGIVAVAGAILLEHHVLGEHKPGRSAALAQVEPGAGVVEEDAVAGQDVVTDEAGEVQRGAGQPAGLEGAPYLLAAEPERRVVCIPWLRGPVSAPPRPKTRSRPSV